MDCIRVCLKSRKETSKESRNPTHNRNYSQTGHARGQLPIYSRSMWNSPRSQTQRKSSTVAEKCVSKTNVNFPISKPNYELPEIYKTSSNKKRVSMTKIVTSISQIDSRDKRRLIGECCQDYSGAYRSQVRNSIYKMKLAEVVEPLKEMSKQKRTQIFSIIKAEFLGIVNSMNLVKISNKSAVFNVYIEKGNNGTLVKQLMKRRWWWHITDQPFKANMIWTHWPNHDLLSQLPGYQLQDEKNAMSCYLGNNKLATNKKSENVEKMIDQKTFKKLKQKIIQSNHNYFATPVSNVIQNTAELKEIWINENQLIHNHVQGAFNLHSKKLLFMNFCAYMRQLQMNPFEYIPLTFYIENPDADSVNELLQKFDELENQKDCQNLWISKPGENSNRGNGIKVITSRSGLVDNIESRLRGQTNHTLIIQKYLEKCFLIKNRKFDIRCFILITTVNGILRGYWYQSGYIRTASNQYNLANDDPLIHLTNDAIQKTGQEFGKHEDNNKLSFDGFKAYLVKNGIAQSKFDEAYKEMKFISYHLIASVSSKIKRKQFSFELFGLDFMLDHNLKPLLIEANSNPSLESSGKILSKLIHELIDNVLLIGVDPIFPPPNQRNPGKRKTHELNSKDCFESNKFQLIFASKQIFK